MRYSFVVENIHCGSCEQDITDVLHEQDPQVEVKFLHDREIVQIDTPREFDVTTAANTLHARGFDVRLLPVKRNLPNWIKSWWKRNPARANGPTEDEAGLDAGAVTSEAPGDTSTEPLPPRDASVGPAERAQAHASICSECAQSNAVRAVFAVSGMTCASCANSITTAVRAALPDVLDVSADALQGAAYVLLRSRDQVGTAEAAISDSGFEPQLTEVLPLSEDGVKEYKLVASIGGMTCASCSASVKHALEDLPLVVLANVEVLDGRAEIITSSNAQNLPRQIVDSVEELGYQCQIVGEFSEVHSAQAKPRARTVTLAVHGIFCERCPQRIMDVLRAHGDAVDIVDPVSVKEPYVKFTYLPSPPRLTIRAILNELRQSNPDLEFEVVRPKSLEELAAENQFREKRAISARLILSTVLAVPATIMMFVPQIMNNDIFFLLATPAYFISASIFHTKALKELRGLINSSRPLSKRLLHFGSMNLLMSLGTSISYWASVVVMVLGGGETYFDSVVFLTFFLLVGRYLDIYSKIKTTSAMSLVSKVRPDEVQLSTNETVNVDLVEVGDHVLVYPGQRCAVDGTIVSKYGCDFDESMLTGESLPVPKPTGSEVFAGTLNIGRHSVEVAVTAVGTGTLLDDIVDAVRHGQMQRAPIERYVEKFTSIFVPIVVYLALLVWLVWYLVSKNVLWSMQFAISTFVVACPCGIGLAAPTALYIGSGLAAKYGILARGGGEAFQEAAALNVICFDKTGTITVGGDMRITDTWGADSDEAVQLASRLEGDSVHPLATAVVEYARGRRVTAARCADIEQVSDRGRGVRAKVTSGDYSGETAIMGNERIINELAGTPLTREQELLLKKWKSQGKSVILLAICNKGVKLMLAAADQIRPESRQVVHDLQKIGIACWMISGDNPETAKAVASSVGIDDNRVIAGVLPQQKSDKIKELQMTAGASTGNSRYGRAIVGMVGDGVNDAPALAASDVGIAQGRGADIALSSSRFVLLREDLRALPILVNISRAVLSKVKANFFWAAIYNCIAIPVAAGLFYPYTHRRLDPVWASLAMALSSVSVMINSFLLSRYRP